MRVKLKMFLLVCSIIVSCFFMHEPVKAVEKSIVLDGNWVSDNIGNSVAFYKFSIPSAGTVTYTLQSYSNNATCALMDEDLTKTYSYIGECNGSTTNPATKESGNILEAGTYYFKTYGRDWWTGPCDWEGNYRLKATFTPANNNETEPNNTFDTAVPLSEEYLLTGLMSEDDLLDFYTFSLSSAQTTSFIYTIGNRCSFTIWDADYLQVAKYTDRTGSGEIETYLQPGTYYFKVTSDRTGTYTLKYRRKQYVSDIKLKKSNMVLLKGKSYNLLSAVLPSDANNKVLKWETSNADIVTVSADGKIKAKNPGGATITASSTDGSKIQSQCFVVVKPEKTVIKSCKRASGLNVTVKVKQQKGISGYQYQLCRKKNFKGKKSSYFAGSTENIATTDALTRNKTYYFKVRSYVDVNGKRYYGDWSKVKKVKTKKSDYLYGSFLWKNI